MQKVFESPAELEKQAKTNYSIPPYLMMENAANALNVFIRQIHPKKCNVQILCGKGNNGADGYALARLLISDYSIQINQTELPASEECKTQQKMFSLMQKKLPDNNELNPKDDLIIVDCIYGTGFHGELPDNIKKIIETANQTKAIKIACDIPSGLFFKADYTITMGEQKLQLFSDKAKEVCGIIKVADLGIPRAVLESSADTKIKLIEKDDIILPLRKKRNSHKGTYGHTVVFAGEKSGAAILSATAAMHFGSGLTTILKTENSNLEQFKISPELMINTVLPKKTTAILAGPGLGELTENLISMIANAGVPVCLDADVLSSPKLKILLEKLTAQKVVITPHLAELTRVLNSIDDKNTYDVAALSTNAELRIQACKIITSAFPNVTVVSKSANTFITNEDDTFIITDGCQNLSKGGSGDILAGMITALLAQGYSAKDAAITTCEQHALAARSFGEEAYNLTPLELISKI